MAKLKIQSISPEVDLEIDTNYGLDGLFLVDDRKGVAGYVDDETAFQVFLFGKDFKYGESGLVKGEVEFIQFLTADNVVFATATDFNLKAATINNLLTSDSNVDLLLDKLLQHNDVITGSGLANVLKGLTGADVIKGKGGADTIIGDLGNDTMFGGAGGDTFEFYPLGGKDVIRDFTIGNGEDSDEIYIRDTAFELVSFKKQLMIEFEDGWTVLLKDVAFADREDVQIDAIL